jgi:hypothetical protein
MKGRFRIMVAFYDSGKAVATQADELYLRPGDLPPTIWGWLRSLVGLREP